MTASAAVGGFAVAQGPARVPITRANPDGLPPYGNSTIPPWRSLPQRRQRQRPDGAHVGSRLRDSGPASRAALARLPRARLQLAQGDGAVGIGGVSRHRPRPARLRAHHRLGRLLRRRSRSLPHAQHGERRHRARLRPRAPLRGDGGGTRRGCAGRVLGRACQARHLPFGDDHELPVRGRAVAAVRHRQRRRPAAPCAYRRRARRGAREAQPSAEVLPELSAHTRGQRQHAACPAGPPRILPRLLPLQECRLEREQTASLEGADRRGAGPDPHLLRDGTGQRHGGNGCAHDAVARPRSRPASG